MATHMSAEEYLARQLEDPELRAEWEALALRRAVSTALMHFRDCQGMTQAALAAQLGLTRRRLDDLEALAAEPTLEELGRISRSLGVVFQVRVAPAGLSVDLAPSDRS